MHINSIFPTVHYGRTITILQMKKLKHKWTCNLPVVTPSMSDRRGFKPQAYAAFLSQVTLCHHPGDLSGSRFLNCACLWPFSLVGHLVKSLGNLCPLPPYLIFSPHPADSRNCIFSKPFLLHWGRNNFLVNLRIKGVLGSGRCMWGQPGPGKTPAPLNPCPFNTHLCFCTPARTMLDQTLSVRHRSLGNPFILQLG